MILLVNRIDDAAAHRGIGVQLGLPSSGRIALGEGFMPLDALLLLAYEAPHFVKFDAGDAETDDAAIVKFSAALADVEGEPGDGLAINVR